MSVLDFANPIHTFSSASKTFTATEECYLYGVFRGHTSGDKLYINDTPIAQRSGRIDICFVPATKLQIGDVVKGANFYDSNTLHVFKEI